MTSPVRIKICGITSEGDARQAALLGADAIGLNFYPPSPRHVEAAVVPSILRALPPFVDAVGVFVNQPLRQVCRQLEEFGRIRTIQWYGEEPELGEPFPYRLIPAFPLSDEGSLAHMTRYLDQCRSLGKLPSAILVDAHNKEQWGGTGQKVPWKLLADFRPGVPLILAGGLTPENVAEAVRIVRPYGVDVASGVESSPGHKDAETMRRFIDRAREAAAPVEPDAQARA